MASDVSTATITFTVCYRRRTSPEEEPELIAAVGRLTSWDGSFPYPPECMSDLATSLDGVEV